MFANIEIKNEIGKCISTKTFKNSFFKEQNNIQKLVYNIQELVFNSFCVAVIY